VENHSLPQGLYLRIAEDGRCFELVGLRHLVVWIGDPLSEIRIIRQKQQSAGVKIQPPDR